MKISRPIYPIFHQVNMYHSYYNMVNVHILITSSKHLHLTLSKLKIFSH